MRGFSLQYLSYHGYQTWICTSPVPEFAVSEDMPPVAPSSALWWDGQLCWGPTLGGCLPATPGVTQRGSGDRTCRRYNYTCYTCSYIYWDKNSGINLKKQTQILCMFYSKSLKLFTTINSLIFMGINVCVFETKPCSRGVIFVVSSGLDNYLATHELFAGIYFCDLKMVVNFAK